MHFQENACILCKLDENACILCKLDENACIFLRKTLPSRVTFILRTCLHQSILQADETWWIFHFQIKDGVQVQILRSYLFPRIFLKFWQVRPVVLVLHFSLTSEYLEKN